MTAFQQCSQCHALKWPVQFHLNSDGTRNEECKACAAGIPRFWPTIKSTVHSVVEAPSPAPTADVERPDSRVVRARRVGSSSPSLKASGFQATETVSSQSPPAATTPTEDLELLRVELDACGYVRRELVRRMKQEHGWSSHRTLRALRQIETVAA